jgi:D-3-phosphoglycerate dehydrogenase
MSMPRIWSDARLVPEVQEQIRQFAELTTGGSYDQLPGCAAAIVSSMCRADGAFMDRAGDTLWAIARPGIGYDNVDVAAATARGIIVITTPDGPTESTAEHAVALLLALAKCVVAGDRHMRAGSFAVPERPGMELRDRTIGLVGFGRIGRRVATICSAGFGMRVLAYDPHIDWSRALAPEVTPCTALDTLLSAADVVSLHTALTEQTRGMIDARRLALMPRGSILINVSRGPVVDEAALEHALRSGHLAGAGLDVYRVEPPDLQATLFTAPNLVTTPHIASYTQAALLAMGRGAAAGVATVLGGMCPTGALNPEIWPTSRARRPG